jgi:hypothetical protein
MALKLDVTRAKDIAVVRCRGRIVLQSWMWGKPQ